MRTPLGVTTSRGSAPSGHAARIAAAALCLAHMAATNDADLTPTLVSRAARTAGGSFRHSARQSADRSARPR